MRGFGGAVKPEPAFDPYRKEKFGTFPGSFCAQRQALAAENSAAGVDLSLSPGIGKLGAG